MSCIESRIEAWDMSERQAGFSYANYLVELGDKGQQTIYEKSSVDLALKDAFKKMRAFLMSTMGLSEERRFP